MARQSAWLYKWQTGELPDCRQYRFFASVQHPAGAGTSRQVVPLLTGDGRLEELTFQEAFNIRSWGKDYRLNASDGAIR